MKFYQPNKGNTLPEELMYFMVFPTKEDCRQWIEENLDEPDTWEIKEYENTDIKGAVLLDGNGAFLYDIVEGACSLSAYNTDKELSAAHKDLLKTIRNILDCTKDRRIQLPDILLYESENDIVGNESLRRIYVCAIDTERIYTKQAPDGYPLENVVDFDDIQMLKNAIIDVIKR